MSTTREGHCPDQGDGGRSPTLADGFGVLVGTADLVANPDAARRVRRILHDRLAGQDGLDQERVDDCAFLLSEVVSNAVQHAQHWPCPLLRVLWVRQRDILRTEVYDADPRLPTVGTAAVGDLDGRGMFLLDAMADRWGAEPIPARGDALWPWGKVVWFAIRGVWTVSI